MPKKCHTDPGEEWRSSVGGRPDGAFSVDHEDSSGDFDGQHSSDRIRGHCSGAEIWYTRPHNRPRFFYTGRFNSGGDVIKGSRRTLQLARKPIRIAEDEEWVATKTTKSTRKR